MSNNDRPDATSQTAEPRLTSGRRRFLAGAAVVAGGVALAPSLRRADAAVPMSPEADETVLRTPDDRFAGLPEYPFEPRYVSVPLRDEADETVRVHYLDERPSDPSTASGETIVLLHGNPSWSYLYLRPANHSEGAADDHLDGVTVLDLSSGCLEASRTVALRVLISTSATATWGKRSCLGRRQASA